MEWFWLNIYIFYSGIQLFYKIQDKYLFRSDCAQLSLFTFSHCYFYSSFKLKPPQSQPNSFSLSKISLSQNSRQCYHFCAWRITCFQKQWNGPLHFSSSLCKFYVFPSAFLQLPEFLHLKIGHRSSHFQYLDMNCVY